MKTVCIVLAVLNAISWLVTTFAMLVASYWYTKNKNNVNEISGVK